MQKIKLKRVSEWFNKNFEYEILINHDEVLELSNGQTKEIELEAPATIQAKLWWCGSKKLNLIAPLDAIQSISVQANPLTHGIAVFLIPLIFITCCLANIFYSGLENYLTGIIIGCMLVCLGLITIWRKTWLKLKIES